MTEADFKLRSLAVAAYGPTIVAAIGYGAMAPVLALRAIELGATPSTAALVVALMGVGQLCSSLPAGALVARVGERKVLIWAALLDAVVSIFAAAAGTVPLLALAAVLGGVLWTAFLQARQGFMIDAVPPSHRARAMAAIGGSMRIGVFIGPLLGAGFIQLWGLRSVFLLAASMSLLAGLIAARTPDLNPAERDSAPLSVWQVISDHRRVLLTVGVAVIVLGASRTARNAILPLWANHIGLDASHTSLVFSFAAAIDMAFFYPGGWLMDRFGRAVTAVSVSGLIAVGILLLPLTDNTVSLGLAAAVMALGNGLGSGIVMTLGADHAPAAGRAQFLGAWRLCGDIGGTTGPLVISAVLALAPLGTACVVVGCLGLLGTTWVGYWTRPSTTG